MSTKNPAALRTWWELPTSAGVFALDPVRQDRDLDLLHTWINDPVVAEFWELDGASERVGAHLAGQSAACHTTPYIGRLDGTPMSYWEIYRADLDPLAQHYDARPHDTGIHLALGPWQYRGRGLGSVLLRAVGDWIFARSAWTTRIVAEPDVRNTASIRAFCNAGFQPAGMLSLPEKTALLVVRERDLLQGAA